MSLLEQAKSESVLGAEEAALADLSLKIIHAAIADRASDIHINPMAKETKVLFRIDGVIQDVVSLPKNVHDPLATRFKSLAGLDTENRRTVQDGRITIEREGTEYDVRENVLPSVWGEKLTMRILDAERGLAPLEYLGYRPADRAKLERALHSPAGLLIFSGPSGAGKTTVMLSGLRQIISPEINVMTVEDPVEYRLPGAVQVHVQRKIGLTFASVARGFMRADPDVIMIGNIENLETAETAYQAAITGHLVLTQLHAADAAGAITRLLDMGIEPFIVAQSLLLTSGQRLVRKVCEKCREKAAYDNDFLFRLRRRAQAEGCVWPAEGPTFYIAKGCDACRNTGYSGRTGIFEMLEITPEIAALIYARATTEEIRKTAIEQGMTTMLADGVYKAMEGITTLEEVLRVPRISI